MISLVFSATVINYLDRQTLSVAAPVLIEQFHSCNRITLDELQRSLYLGGFHVRKVELMAETIHIPPALECLPLSLLGVSGVKLLATVPG